MSSASSVASVTSSIEATSASSTAKATIQVGSNLKVVGIILAIVSGVLIGSSFVFKKKGLLRSQAGGVAGEGVAYLKSPLWWLGMIMMILGELCNFAAYAFVEAIVVTPLGALSVVICAILSSFFLNEKLTFFGWLGCALCILGSVIIALNGPKEESVGQIREFQKLFLSPGFLVYGSVLIAASIIIIVYFGPKYGRKHMLWYILVCSMIGGISVSVTTGLGAAIVTTAYGDNQFKYWFMYFLMGFVIVTLLTEVYYLNVALALFNTAMVTPTYYVIFTFFSMVTTIVLFKGLKASPAQIITLVMAFLVICLGITILQMSKIDPMQLEKLDRRSTMLLRAAQSQTESMDEKSITGIEDPGMDALRGSFGALGSAIRARSVRRMSQSSSARPPRSSGVSGFYPRHGSSSPIQGLPLGDPLSGVRRHQLYDAPVPRDDTSTVRSPSIQSSNYNQSQIMNKRPTIKFDSQDVVHQYNRPGTGDNMATHEHRAAGVRSPPPATYPPKPPSMASQTSFEHFVHLEGLDRQLHQQQQQQQPQHGGSRSGSDSDHDNETESDRQTLLVNPRLGFEPAVQSAPPLFQARFPVIIPRTRTSSNNSTIKRKDSLLADSPSSISLLGFPQPTDSASRSDHEQEQGWDEEELERQKQRARDVDRGRSVVVMNAKQRRYPKGDGEDDREESVSLWHGRSPAMLYDGDDDYDYYDDQDGNSALAGPTGGIRLVQPSTDSASSSSGLR
ncbi:hypothetical protein AMATHDRAFT_64010 [Amanita thiersii Skay4041]|uniref:DUF803-domain-containing protein n=1 Tax=Amanita thiersii Skay4041 TaxID=703135 RepID=A0A2A9NMQ5_9AGAR|nr:hypothetical protein AMATHDRAFT_64010 [Amanita thiersii Skay4041]